MNKTQVLSAARYGRLVKDIRRIMEEGKQRAVQTATKELVRTKWNVGRRICQEGLTDNAGYNVTILKDVAKELGMDYSNLARCVQFFQAYEIAPGSDFISWSHYKYLIPLQNEERQWYARLVETKKMDRLRLANAIKEDQYSKSRQEPIEPKARAKLKRPTEPTYVYKAVVDRVVDADTLLLRLDLGFQVWKEQRVRLAGINASEMDTPEGEAATLFVLSQLAKVAFVMIKTNKIDVYGRYVGHIFYSLKSMSKEDIFLKGRYLNQDLVDKGLVEIM